MRLGEQCGDPPVATVTEDTIHRVGGDAHGGTENLSRILAGRLQAGQLLESR